MLGRLVVTWQELVVVSTLVVAASARQADEPAQPVPHRAQNAQLLGGELPAHPHAAGQIMPHVPVMPPQQGFFAQNFQNLFGWARPPQTPRQLGQR